MNLLKQLNEASTSIELMQNVCEAIKNGAQFFKDRGDSDQFLLRGAKDTHQIVALMSPRKDRKPSDTTPYTQELMDEFFVGKFGFPYRSGGVFTISNPGTASNYGKVSIILPSGPYKTCTSATIHDAYRFTNGRRFYRWVKDNGTPEQLALLEPFNTQSLQDTGNTLTNIMGQAVTDTPEIQPLFKNWLTSVLKQGNYYEGNIAEAMKMNSEIMLQCTQYYRITAFQLSPVHLQIVRKIINDPTFYADEPVPNFYEFITALSRKLL